MKTQNTFSISFFLKKDKDKVKGDLAPLYARITVNGKSKDLSTKRRVKISAWNQKSQKLLGNEEEDIAVKEKIRQLTIQINNAYDDLRHQKKIVTAETVKTRTEGLEDEEPKTLNFLMKYHDEVYKDLLEEGTMKNYRTTSRFIKEFLIIKKKKTDIYLAQLDNVFITGLSLFLLNRKPDKGQKKCTNNTFMKHMERLKKMIGIAKKNKWMTNDPFESFERKIIPKDRGCLDSEELARLRTVDLFMRGHIIVRDMTLFSSLTGLAYCDIVRFKLEHIVKDAYGEHWIEMYRKKTKNFTERKFFVLLLPEAIELIEKYKNDPASLQKGTIFPYFSNQTTNRYLKIIAKKAEILKPITFHWARHTFATTVTLENGVSIESVSQMLGHASMRTTQIYSKVKKKKVLNEMSALREKVVQPLLRAV